ncbi:TorF family putative porin [Brevundimonas sp.]
MKTSILVALGLVGIACPAWAQSSDWSVSGTAGVVSDYRYRGYSLSGERPAFQGGLTAGHASGLYGDVFVSTIDEYGVGSDGDGADVEITGTLGWAGQVGGFDVDVAAAAYRYPDGDDVNYVEFPLQLGRTHGAVTWAIGAAFAPAQSALGDEENRYGWTSLSFAPSSWPVSVNSTVGYEDGAFAPEGKTDWSVGIARELGRFRLDLSWVDSDADDGQAVASVFVNF